MGGTVYYYKVYGNTIYKYTLSSATSNTSLSSWSYGSTGYSLTSDGTYLYRGHGSTGGTQLYRTKLSDESTDTINTATAYLHFHHSLVPALQGKVLQVAGLEIEFVNVSNLVLHDYFCPTGYNQFEKAVKGSYTLSKESTLRITPKF